MSGGWLIFKLFLFNNYRLLIVKHIPLQDALPFFTENPASIMKFKNKGKIEVGFDADVTILDQDMNIKYVISKGVLVKTPSFVQKGMFE